MDQGLTEPKGLHCAKCGAAEMMRNVHIKDRSGNVNADFTLTAEVPEHPSAMFFRANRHSRLVATICGRCGFAELYAESYADLWYAYQKGRGEIS